MNQVNIIEIFKEIMNRFEERNKILLIYGRDANRNGTVNTN